uniref:Uncharacterized protein n=1 Tax=Arundo donax TaxID=35708 RepID=A0A0A9B288_ARUDO
MPTWSDGDGKFVANMREGNLEWAGCIQLFNDLNRSYN